MMMDKYGMDKNSVSFNSVELRNQVNNITGKVREENGIVRSLPGRPEKEPENFMDLIGEKKKEIYDKIRSGEIDGAVQIGGSIFTASEWDMIIKRIDSAIGNEDSPIKEAKEEEEAEEGQDKSIGEITQDMLDALFVEKDKESVTGSKNASGTDIMTDGENMIEPKIKEEKEQKEKILSE